MLRTLGAALRTLVKVPAFIMYTALESTRVNRIPPGDDAADRIDEIARRWTERFAEIPPIRLTVEGVENADPSQRYIVVSNHMSNFDIPTAIKAMPVRTRFISKQEVSKIPLFGEAAIRTGVVMIDREASRSNHEELNRAVAQSLAEGNSILVFAEGTRSRTGEMGKFHRGAARLALAAGVDILPIVIYGTYEVSPPGSLIIYPGDVTLRILPPISLEKKTAQDVRAITDDLRRQISENYEELAAERHQS